jgi:hypothetical protein
MFSKYVIASKTTSQMRCSKNKEHQLPERSPGVFQGIVEGSGPAASLRRAQYGRLHYPFNRVQEAILLSMLGDYMRSRHSQDSNFSHKEETGALRL